MKLYPNTLSVNINILYVNTVHFRYYNVGYFDILLINAFSLSLVLFVRFKNI